MLRAFVVGLNAGLRFSPSRFAAPGLNFASISSSHIDFAGNCFRKISLQAIYLGWIELERTEAVGKSERIQHHAGAVGKRFGLQDIHSPRGERSHDVGKQARTIERQQHQLEVTLATQYVDLRFVILEFEPVVHLAVRNNFGRECASADSVWESLPETK